jgi:peptidoglycan hydrolase FlgJ
MNVTSLQRKLEASDIPPEQLAGNKQLTEAQKIGEATREFEAILLRQILESTQKTVIQSKLSSDSTASTIYRDLITNQLADSISKSGGVGLAKTLHAEFTRQLHSKPESKVESTETEIPAADRSLQFEGEKDLFLNPSVPQCTKHTHDSIKGATALISHERIATKSR